MPADGRTARHRPDWLPRVGPALLLAAAGGLLLLSLRAWASAASLQDRLDRDWALDAASQRLGAVLQQGGAEALDLALATIVDREHWGFRYLAVLDRDGQALAVQGRYENFLRSLPDTLHALLRSRLYGAFGETGQRTLRDGGRTLGSLEYALGSDGDPRVRDEAVARLRQTGIAGVLLALLLAAGAVLVLRDERRRRAQQAVARLPDPAPVATAAMNGGAAAGDSLDALQIGLIRVDAGLHVREINAAASQLTGWTAEAALGQLVYTVFHVRDGAGEPQAGPAERCLQEGSPQPPVELQLRPRAGQGAVRTVEAQAAPQPLADGSPGALLLFQDVDARRAGREALHGRARRAEAIVDHVAEAVLTADAGGLVRSANARALRLFGYGADEMLRMTMPRLLPVPFMNTPGLKLADYVAGGSARLPKVAGWRKDATTFPAELLVEPMAVDGETRLVVVVRDLTERLRSQSLAQRLGRLLDAASEEVYVFDAQSLYFIEVNRGARRNLGLKPEQLARMSLTSIATDLEPATLQGYLAKLRGGDDSHLSYKTRHRRADGSTYPVEVRLSFSRDEEPPVFMAIALDITEREAAERRARQLAHHDPLTGLPNRTLLFDRLKQAMHGVGRSDRQLALFFLDLDGFRAVNDRLGHEAGDRLLRMVADRLGSGLRAADTVARLGGDEFVVLAQGQRDADDARRLATKILEQFEVPFDIGGEPVALSTAVGISLFPQDRADADTLLRHAQGAMQQAKAAGRGQVRVHPLPGEGEPVSGDAAGERANLNRDVAAGLAAGEFELRLLPVFDLDGAVVASISDFGWRHPRYGEIGSAETLRAARRHGLNAGIEAWQLRETLRQHQPGLGLPPLPALLPLTARQWRDPEFTERLRRQLEDFRVPVSQLLPLIDGEDWADAAAPVQLHWSALLGEGLRIAVRAPPPGARLDGVGLVLVPPQMAGGVERDDALAPVRDYARLGRPLLLEAAPARDFGQRLRQAGVRYLCGPALQAPLRPVDFIHWVDSRTQRPL